MFDAKLKSSEEKLAAVMKYPSVGFGNICGSQLIHASVRNYTSYRQRFISLLKMYAKS